MIKKGNRVRIKNNLSEELIKLGFFEETIEALEEIIGKEYTVYDLWEDERQIYATVDLCLEIPIQCLELIQS